MSQPAFLPMSEPAKILIVEDEWIVARAVQKTLESEGFTVTGVTGSREEALGSIESVPPDLILLDIVLGNGSEVDGIRLAKEIRSRRSTPIVFVTAHADAQTVSRAAEVEPAGFVVKPFQEAQLISTVRMVVRRPGAVSEPATPDAQVPNAQVQNIEDPRKQKLQRVVEALARGAALSSSSTELTSRELDVVRLLLSNGRVSSIAEHLGISPHTVRNHLRSIFRKLGVHSQIELIRELSSRVSSF